jgi:hypothetical protein
MDQRLEDVLKRDAVAEYEEIFGEVPRDGSQVEREDALALLGYAFRVNRQKEAALKERGDSHFGTTLEQYRAIVTDLGFELVLEMPFRGRSYSDAPNPRETLFVYWRPDGVLLKFDTYGGDQLNSSDFYYNWRPRPGTTNSERCQATQSGGWRAPKGGPKWPDYAELYDEHGKEREEGREKVRAYNEWLYTHGVWAGNHDGREAIRHNIAKLEEFGSFVNPWQERPHLWLLHYMDTKDENGDSLDYRLLNSRTINEERILLLPSHVQRAITPVGEGE